MTLIRSKSCESIATTWRIISLWDKVDRTLFKLSNYRVRMEIGADPEFRGIDWEIVKGGEYLLFERVVESVKLLNEQSDAAPEQWL